MRGRMSTASSAMVLDLMPNRSHRPKIITGGLMQARCGAPVKSRTHLMRRLRDPYCQYAGRPSCRVTHHAEESLWDPGRDGATGSSS